MNKEGLLSQLISHQIEAVEGRPPAATRSEISDMKCVCGSNMHKVTYVAPNVRGLPHHKKKRIRKKKLKQWRDETGPARMASMILGVMKPWFQCHACGKRETLMKAASRNVFQVEPLPLPDHLSYEKPK